MSETAESSENVEPHFMSVWVKCEIEDLGDNSDTDDHTDLYKYENDEDWSQYSNKKRKSQNKRKRADKPTTPLKCDFCDFTTVYKNSLVMHTTRHSNYKPYSCKFCEYTTKYTSCLRRHMIMEHQCTNTGEEITPMKCDLCDYTTLFKDNLNAHKRKHKTEKRYQCDQCEYSTSYINNHKKHKKKHMKEVVAFKCDKCPFVTKYSGHIHRHLSQIHNEVTEKAKKCEFCDFSTIVGWRLNIHKQRSRQNEPIQCTHCEYKTFYKCESKKHKNTHYNDIYVRNDQERRIENQEPIEIPQDFSAQNSSYEYNPSFANDDLEDLFHYTSQLPNTYSDKIDKKNIQVLDTSNPDRPFGCSKCNYTSKFKATVQRHYQRHHMEDKRPYHCTKCDFKTKTKDQITLHNKRSISTLEMSCQTCDFKTIYKCQFAEHQRSHYTFKCEMCNYTCKHKYEVEKHMRTAHLGMTHACKYCGFKANSLEAVLCHEALHTGSKPFKCSFCSYQTVRTSLLYVHNRRYHSDLTDVKVISASKVESLKVSLLPEASNVLSQDYSFPQDCPLGIPDNVNKET